MFDANKLIKDINTKKRNWNERSQFKIKGVGNLSVSDLDTLELYASTFLRVGNINMFMKPLGSVKEVLEKYGLEIDNGFGW